MIFSQSHKLSFYHSITLPLFSSAITIVISLALFSALHVSLLSLHVSLSKLKHTES